MNILLINGAQEDGSMSKAFINSFILKAKLKRKGNKEQIIYNKLTLNNKVEKAAHIITLLSNADIIIFVLPIVFHTIPAILKNMIERVHTHFTLKENRDKKGFIILAQPEKDYSVDPIPEFFNLIGAANVKKYELQEQKDIDKTANSLIKTLKI